MSILVYIVLFGWIPLVLATFCLCRPRTAVLISLFGAWLFLPVADFSIPGLPDYGKISAGPVAAMLGVLLFDPTRLRQLRLSVWDLPMLVVLLSPFISAIKAGFGVYDGFSSVANVAGGCGIAYLLGRMYFIDRDGRGALATAFVVAGLLYVPLCLYEIRLSPQLHQQVYGYSQHMFAQTYRMGGWRPMVFMQHGLAVGLFMSAASAVAIWLWLTGERRTLAGVPIGVCAILLLVIAVLCKSAFALAILALALIVLVLVRMTQWRVFVVLLAMLPPLYMAGRITGIIEGHRILTAIEPMAGDQIGSLSVRIQSEEVLIPRAMQHATWGVSRWSLLVEDGNGNRTDELDHGVRVVPDALWVLTLANRGLIGLAALVMVFVFPVLLLLRRRSPVGSGSKERLDPAIVLAVVLCMHMADNLLNAMVSPVFWMIAGALLGVQAVREPRKADATVTIPAAFPRAWS